MSLLVKDAIKCWHWNGFRLYLWEAGQRWDGKARLAYRLVDRGVTIFEGADYGCSPCHAIDSLEAVCSLLAFLSLGKGDTDAEYFDSYTPAQLAWRDDGSRREELSLYVYRTEERLDARRRKGA